MSPRAFAFGDRLTHAAKPEWGVGQVLTAQTVVQDGAECQRLQVRFERAGLKTLSTAVADLRPAGAVEVSAEAAAPAAEPVNLDDPQAAMSRVPEEAKDPFLGLAQRLEKTLAYYAYQPHGASLLDWAAVQSGLKDPLARFNRHELEAFFERFRRNLDTPLSGLVRELGRKDPKALAAVTAGATSHARDAVRRAHARR